MSTNNKKSIAAQALLEMDEITSAIKEESKKSLKNMLAEAAKEALREACESEEDDKDYEVIDGEQNDAEDNNEDNSNDSSQSDVDENENDETENGVVPQGAEEQVPAEPQSPDMASQEAPVDGSELDSQETPEGDDEYGWDDASKYQVGNDTYDLTGENDYDSVVKVYKLLKDTDKVVIKKEGNTIQLKDENADTEYVIDLGSDDEDASAEAVNSEDETNPEAGLNESFDDAAGFMDDENDDFENDGFDVENGSQPWDDEELSIEDKIDQLQQQIDSLKSRQSTDPAFAGVNENKKTRKPMKESKEVLFEVDLGYTDNYQDKDPIAGLSNNEPSKSGKSWHKGVPTGTKKPWAGETKSKSDPFKETKKVEGSVNEEEINAPEDVNNPLEEGGHNVGGFVQQNTTPMSVPSNSNGRKARNMRGSKTTGTADPRYSTNESKELKAVKNENKELKEAIIALRKNLNEAYITNVNLGKITKLFLENTTSLQEKHEIVNRFANEAKTVEQATALYESINKQLKKNDSSLNLTESKTANGTKALNEEKVYKSNDLLKTIDLMNRMNNC